MALELESEVALGRVDPEVACGATKTVAVDWPPELCCERMRFVDALVTMKDDESPPPRMRSVEVESPVVVGRRSTKSEYGRVEHPKFHAV